MCCLCEHVNLIQMILVFDFIVVKYVFMGVKRCSSELQLLLPGVGPPPC